MSTTTDTRRDRLEALKGEYGGEWGRDMMLSADVERFASVQEGRPGYWIETFATEAAALRYLEDDALDGWSPCGVIDLDTGESIGVHVSVKVTRSDDASPLMVPWEAPEEATTFYVETAFPEVARWRITGPSPAADGWVFATECTTGAERAFPPGALRPQD